MNSSRGSISAFVVCITMSLISLVGFIYDGGRVITTYARLSDIAENASRIGSQQVVGIRAGDPHLDETAARRRINTYLGEQGVAGNVAVRDGGSVVEIRAMVPMRLLSLFGISERQVKVSRSSHVVQG